MNQIERIAEGIALAVIGLSLGTMFALIVILTEIGVIRW